MGVGFFVPLRTFAARVESLLDDCLVAIGLTSEKVDRFGECRYLPAYGREEILPAGAALSNKTACHKGYSYPDAVRRFECSEPRGWSAKLHPSTANSV